MPYTYFQDKIHPIVVPIIALSMQMGGIRSHTRSDPRRLDNRLRTVEIAFAKVDQRLLTLERATGSSARLSSSFMPCGPGTVPLVLASRVLSTQLPPRRTCQITETRKLRNSITMKTGNTRRGSASSALFAYTRSPDCHRDRC